MDYNELELAWPRSVAKTTPGLNQVYAYLAKRGITPQYTQELGFKIVPAHGLVTAAMGTRLEKVNPGFRENRLAIVIPHLHSQWWCARLVDVDVVPLAGWEKMVEGTSKRAKMFAPPGVSPDAWLAPTLDWDSGLQKGARIHIHESAIKAANGARLGYWSIGLNGVWGWSNKKSGRGMPPAMQGLPWRKLELVPVIVFDSNYETNFQVKAAAEKLAERLMSLTGRKAEIMSTPRGVDGRHRGFDDFCVEEGDKRAVEWLEVGGVAADLDPLRLAMMEINDKVCIVESMSRIAELETGTLMSRYEFCDVNYARLKVYNVITEKFEGVAKAWMGWEWQTRVRALAYTPGAERITEAGDLNLWRGWGCAPVGGNVKPWLELLADCIPDKDHQRRIIQWFAYPLQVPGGKLTTALLLYGPPGSGKDALLMPIKALYGGDNAVEISSPQLKSSFNSIYASRQFVHANELQRSFDSQDVVNQVLKLLITSEFQTVNRKGQPEYTVRNVCNVAITSNYADCVKMDEDDRRLYIHEWKGRHVGPEHQGYWDKYFTWSQSQTGPAALHAYLLGVDLTGFNPAERAAETEAKEFMREALRSPLEEWIHRLKIDPDGVLGLHYIGRCLFTSDELANVYNASAGERGQIAPVRMGKACFKFLNKTPRMRLGDDKHEGEKFTYWIVRGTNKDWSTPKMVKKNGGRN